MTRLLTTVLILVLFSSNLIAQVAILELDAHGVSEDKAAVFSQNLETELFRTGVYKLIERQKIDAVIDEYKIQLSGLTETEKAVQLGLLLNAEYVVTGSVNRVEGIYSATSKMISVENGGIHSVANIYGQLNFNDLLINGTNSLAAQLSGMPVTEIEVVQMDVISKSNPQPSGNLVPKSKPSSQLNTKLFAKYVVGQTLVSDKKVYGTKGFAFGVAFGEVGLWFEHTEDKYNSDDTDERRRETNLIAFDVGYEIFRANVGFGPRTQYNYFFEEDQTNMIFKGTFSLNFSSRWVGVEPVLGYTMGDEKLDWYWGVNFGLYPYQW